MVARTHLENDAIICEKLGGTHRRIPPELITQWLENRASSRLGAIGGQWIQQDRRDDEIDDLGRRRREQ